MAIEGTNAKGRGSPLIQGTKELKAFLSIGLVNGKIQSLFIVHHDDKKLTGGVTSVWLLEYKHSQAMADV